MCLQMMSCDQYQDASTSANTEDFPEKWSLRLMPRNTEKDYEQAIDVI